MKGQAYITDYIEVKQRPLLLELYSGTQSVGEAFRAIGWEVLSVEVNPKFLTDPYNLEQWTIDIIDVTIEGILERCGRLPDVIWASPVCTTDSIAAISHYRKQIKDKDLLISNGHEKAEYFDKRLLHTLRLIQEIKPKYYFIENPRGGMRKKPIMQGLFYRYTVTYCSYGHNTMKPTDIWTNHPEPNLKPMCHNGNKDCHHESAPRGSKTGVQGLKGNTERSVIPKELCDHIASLCERRNHV